MEQIRSHARHHKDFSCSEQTESGHTHTVAPNPEVEDKVPEEVEQALKITEAEIAQANSARRAGNAP